MYLIMQINKKGTSVVVHKNGGKIVDKKAGKTLPEDIQAKLDEDEDDYNDEIARTEAAYRELCEGNEAIGWKGLSAKDSYYIALKVGYHDDGRFSSGIALIYWRASAGKKKLKNAMMYSSAVGGLKSALSARCYGEYESVGDMSLAELMSKTKAGK